MPRQDCLGGSDSVFGGDRRDDWIGEEVAASTQRAPRFGDDAVFSVVRQRVDLREVGMQFDLVDDGQFAGLATKSLQMLR